MSAEEQSLLRCSVFFFLGHKFDFAIERTIKQQTTLPRKAGRVKNNNTQQALDRMSNSPCSQTPQGAGVSLDDIQQVNIVLRKLLAENKELKDEMVQQQHDMSPVLETLEELKEKNKKLELAVLEANARAEDLVGNWAGLAEDVVEVARLEDELNYLRERDDRADEIQKELDYQKLNLRKAMDENETVHKCWSDAQAENKELIVAGNKNSLEQRHEIDELKKQIKEYEFESNESGVKDRKLYAQAFAIQAERDALRVENDELRAERRKLDDEANKLTEDLENERKVSFWHECESYNGGLDADTKIYDPKWIAEMNVMIEERFEDDLDVGGLSVEELQAGYLEWATNGTYVQLIF